MENKIELTFLRVDENTGNFIYKGSDGKIYTDVEGVYHNTTNYGEPDSPAHNVHPKKGEPIYNPEDRFGRNPESKTQAETVDGLKQFIKEEVKKLQKLVILKEEKLKINKKLVLLKETRQISDDLIAYDVPDWALSALINGDLSGITDEEEQQLSAFTSAVVNAHGNAHFLIGDLDGDDDLGFSMHNDIDKLGGNVYRLYIKPSNENKSEDKPMTEMSKPLRPIGEKTMATLTKWIQEKGAKKTAIALINKFSETGMVSDFPDSIEYGQGVNRIESLLSRGNYESALYSAKSLATKLEKKAMKDFGF